MNNDDKWNNCRREFDQSRNVEIEGQGTGRLENQTEKTDGYVMEGEENKQQVSEDRNVRGKMNRSYSGDKDDTYTAQRGAYRPHLSNSFERQQGYDQLTKNCSSTSINNSGKNDARRYMDISYERTNKYGQNNNLNQGAFNGRNNSAENLALRPNNIVNKYYNNAPTYTDEEMKNKNMHLKSSLEDVNAIHRNLLDESHHVKYKFSNNLYDGKLYSQLGDNDFKRNRSNSIDYDLRNNGLDDEKYFLQKEKRRTSSYADNEAQKFNMQDDFIGRRFSKLCNRNDSYAETQYDYNDYGGYGRDTYNNYERDSNYEECVNDKTYNEREAYFESFHQTPHGEVKNTYYNPFAVKHRRRTSKMQLRVLEKTFETNIRPDAALRKILGEQLGMTPRSVQVWFQNRRAKIKKNKKGDDKKDVNSYEKGNIDQRGRTGKYYNERGQYNGNSIKNSGIDYLEERVRAHSVVYPETFANRNASYSNESKNRASSVVYPDNCISGGNVPFKLPSGMYTENYSHSIGASDKSTNGQLSAQNDNNFTNGMYFSPISPQDGNNFYTKIDGEYGKGIEKSNEFGENMEDVEDYESKYMNL